MCVFLVSGGVQAMVWYLEHSKSLLTAVYIALLPQVPGWVPSGQRRAVPTVHAFIQVQFLWLPVPTT